MSVSYCVQMYLVKVFLLLLRKSMYILLDFCKVLRQSSSLYSKISLTIPKDRQAKKDKRTNNNLQNTIHKTKDRAKLTPHKTRVNSVVPAG
jgi:hypothetical protein